MAEKVNTKLLDDEAKKEAITGEETSKYSSFNNKYLKAALLAVGSYYLAKKDPYVLQGINVVKDKLEDADAESRRDYIKSSATSIGKVIAENRARRKERLIDFKQKIKDLNQYTKDSYVSANIIKDNLYTDMMKYGKQGKDVSTLYTVTNDFKKQNTGLGINDLAGALAEPVDNISKDLNTKFLAPKRTSFISNLISGGGQEDVSEEVKAQIQAIAPDIKDDNIEDLIIGGGAITEKGQRFLRPKIAGGLTETRAQKQIMDAVAKSLGGVVKIDSSGGEIVYSYDSEIQKRLENASSVTGDLLLEVEKMMGTEGYTRREAVQAVIKKYNLGSVNTTYSPIAGAINKKQTNNNKKEKNEKKDNEPTTLTLPKTATAIEDTLLKLKNNPPKGQGNKIDTVSYNKDKQNLKAKFIQVLTGDSDSSFFNNQAEATKYVNDFLSKNEI